MIHALRYTEDLEKAGFSAEQAKASVKIWMDLMSDNFATRSDFKEYQFMTRSDLREFQVDFGSRLDKLDQKFSKRCDELDQKIDKRFDQIQKDMQLLEAKLTVKLGSIMVIGIGLLGALKLI